MNKLKALAAMGIGIGILATVGHYTSDQKYDAYDAVMFGIASADYGPGQDKELIEHEARKKWANDPRHQRQFIDDAMSGYLDERRAKQGSVQDPR
jgi:hypothetical protein